MFSAKSDSHLQFSLSHILIHTHTHVGSSQGKYRHTNWFVWLQNHGFTDKSSGFRNNNEGFTKKIGGQCICQHLYLMIPGCQVVFPPGELVFPGAVHIGASDGSRWSLLDICFNLVDLILFLVISCNFMLSCHMCLQEWSISQAMAGHQAMVEIPWLGPSQAANGPCPVEAIGHYLSDGPLQVGSPKIIQPTPVSN